MVQGAATGSACLEGWAVFNQGIQAPGFLFSSSFLPWPREGHTGIDMQVGNRAWLWLIEKAEREWLFFPSSVRYPSFKRKKKKWPREGNFSFRLRKVLHCLTKMFHLPLNFHFLLAVDNNVVLFIRVELVDFLSLKSLPLVTPEKHTTILPVLWRFIIIIIIILHFLHLFVCAWLSEIHGS